MNKLIWLYNKNNYEYYKRITSFHLINLKFVWIIYNSNNIYIYIIIIIKHPERTINMIYLIVLTFNWEPDAIIKLKQL